MDLFHVERYRFNEDEEEENTPEVEKERLRILNEKSRKRKLERAKLNDSLQNETVEVDDITVPKPKKKKKKSKDVVLDQGEDQKENSVTEHNLDSPKIKKKKKKKKNSETSQLEDEHREEEDINQLMDVVKPDVKDNNTIAEIDLDSSKTKKKKKKKMTEESPRKDKNEENDDVSQLNKADDIKYETKGNEKEKSSKKKKKHLKSDAQITGIEDINDDVDKNAETLSTDKDQSLIETEANELIENGNEKDATKETYFPILGSTDPKKEKAIVKRTLPKWISNPKLITADITRGKVGLDNVSFLEDFLKDRLKEQEIEYLFPVQAVFIPYLLSQLGNDTVYGKGGFIPADICVSAPTGSGKTLSYVLPIVQILSHCFVRRLQAIVILPSKDLAAQIKTVISSYVRGTQVRVGLAAGMKSFQQEQQQLVNLSPNGIASTVDILVCTPGRLVDHISQTEGFTLEHLRFLIIDEADRLLGQSYHNWLDKIFKAAFRSKQEGIRDSSVATFRSPTPSSSPSSVGRVQLPLQKLLFSATMTQNPEKLAPLQLVRPVLFTSSEKCQGENVGVTNDQEEEEASNERYILPENLTEKMTVCKQGEKPLILIYLMKILKYERVLCFTGSIEATHRLFLLVKACDIRVAEFSSTLNQSQRKGTLRDFKIGKIDLLICSDAMSRGMDIDNVNYVISYDPPVNSKTYVHRVGRTARAGQSGVALTLLSSKEVYHFKKIIRTGKRTTLQKLNVSSTDLEPLVENYEEALVSLKEAVNTERTQAFKHS